MLTQESIKTPALETTLRDNTLSNYPQSFYNFQPLIKANPNQFSKKDSPNIYDKIEEYFIKHPKKLTELEKAEENPSFFNKRKKYKKRRWRGHSYGHKILLHLAYLLQSYWFAYGVEGKDIYPAKATLAKEIGVCIRTLDKALHALKDMGVVTWFSGKENYTTNTYYLEEAYKKTPMKNPEDGFKHPRHIWLKLQYNVKKKQLKHIWRIIYEHFLKDIADHMLRIYKYIRTPIEESIKNPFKTSKDPPKERKKPPNWSLLRPLQLNFKDQHVLGRYSEAVLRSSIDDMNAYLNWGKTINNKGAFLESRCKTHQQEMEANQKIKNPINIKEWLCGYFKTHRSRFQFINEETDLDRTTKEPRPFIALKFHKEDFELSSLKVFQKVKGAWIEKIFSFDRQDLYTAIKNYLENSLKQMG